MTDYDIDIGQPFEASFHLSRDVHGNGKDRDPAGPMEFQWKWEYDQPW